MPIGALIALIVLLGGGGGASIAAQNSLPGDALYPVKVGFNEKIGGVFQLTEAARTAWESKLAETRLDEAAKLAAESRLDANWKTKLEADFKTHADIAEKNMEDIKSGGNAADAADLAGKFEAGLRARHDILDKLKEADKIEIDSEINDVVKVREDAEAEEKSDAEKNSEGGKNSAEGKINAASEVINSVKDFLGRSDVSTSTKAEAQAKLSVAEGLLAQAQAKLSAGDYGAALGLGQQALRAAQEARFSGEVRDELNIETDDKTDSEIDIETSDRKDDGENHATSSERRKENEKDSGIKVNGETDVKIGL